MDSFQLLHISDLHVSKEKDFDRSVVLDPLIARLQEDYKKGLRPELVVITGDIAFSGLREEYLLAKGFLDDLGVTLGLGSDRFFLVPGNHDVNRKAYRPRDIPSYDNMAELNSELENPDYQADLFKGLADYFKFVEEHYPHLKSTHGRLVPFIHSHQAACGKKIGLVGLNSAWMCRKSPDREDIAIGEYQIKKAMEELQASGGHDLVIALFHHPLAWLWPEDRNICRGYCNDLILLAGHLHDTEGLFVRDLRDAFHHFQAGGAYLGSESKWPMRYQHLTVDFAAGTIRLDFRRYAKDRRWVIDSEKGRDGAAIFPLKGEVPGPGPDRPPAKVCPQRAKLEKYLQAALNEHRHLPAQGFETTLRVPIELERVYINMRARISANDEKALGRHGIVGEESAAARETEMSSLDIKAAVEAADRHHIKDMIILGHPGAGKTTLLKYILITLIQGQGARLGLSEGLIPYFAPLRDRKDKEEFLPFLMRCSGLEDCGVSQATAESIFENDCGLVLLDGLDEVADQRGREETCQWIDKARKRLLPSTRFIVTSRFAGYYGRSRLQGNVLELRIQDFTPQEVQEFLVRWFETVETALHPDADEARWQKKGKQEGEKLASDIDRSESLKKLAVNPLLLQILALVHRDRGRIPERRVELYEECTNVLLEKWDMARGLDGCSPPGRPARCFSPSPSGCTKKTSAAPLPWLKLKR